MFRNYDSDELLLNLYSFFYSFHYRSDGGSAETLDATLDARIVSKRTFVVAFEKEEHRFGSRATDP